MNMKMDMKINMDMKKDTEVEMDKLVIYLIVKAKQKFKLIFIDIPKHMA